MTNRVPAAMLGLVMLIPACEKDPNDVDRLLVRVGTGAEGSDGDVEFCYTLDEQEYCHPLSSGGNDFEASSQRTYEVTPTVSFARDRHLANLKLEYTGFVGDEWAVASLNVVAVTEGGQQVVLCDSRQTETIRPGSTYNPTDCP